MKEIKKNDIRELERIRANIIILVGDVERVLTGYSGIKEQSRQWVHFMDNALSVNGGMQFTIEQLKAALKKQEIDEEEEEEAARAAAEEEEDDEQ